MLPKNGRFLWSIMFASSIFGRLVGTGAENLTQHFEVYND